MSAFRAGLAAEEEEDKSLLQQHQAKYQKKKKSKEADTEEMSEEKIRKVYLLQYVPFSLKYAVTYRPWNDKQRERKRLTG